MQNKCVKYIYRKLGTKIDIVLFTLIRIFLLITGSFFRKSQFLQKSIKIYQDFFSPFQFFELSLQTNIYQN